jgi:CBS domain-containing protein
VTRKMRDIMSSAPVCMASTETVSAAAKAMKEHGVGTALVLADGRLSGLITDRDITVRVLAENRDPLTTLVGEICSSEVAVLSPDDGVEQAERLVRERAMRRIPVLQDGIPVGVVSIGDLSPFSSLSPQKGEKGEGSAFPGIPAASPGS